jgi:hypothetical protein
LTFYKEMKIPQLIAFALFATSLGSCKERVDSTTEEQEDLQISTPPSKIDYSKILPEKQDGEFFRSLREEPNQKVVIDLRNPSDLSGIPEVKWFPMGNDEFCAIQGTTDTTLILPSGRVIEEEFHIVYVDRDSEGIFEVKADSLGWLKLDVAKKRLDREVELMIADGYDEQTIKIQRESVMTWLKDFDHNSSMRSGIAQKTDDFTFIFGFAVTIDIDLGIRYRYETKLSRSEERRSRKYKKMQNRVPVTD